MVTHKAGELFALSSGEYSDFRFNGLYRTLRDVDMAALANEYSDGCKPYEWDESRKNADANGWGAWLIANGHAEEVPYDEIHCGSYDFEFDQIASDLGARAV